MRTFDIEINVLFYLLECYVGASRSYSVYYPGDHDAVKVRTRVALCLRVL